MMAQNYDNVQPEIFYDDLREKNIVIMVHGPNGELKGFSTQEIFKHRVGDHVFRVIFTGDTIVNPSSWGSMEFPITLMKWMLAVWKEEPSVPLLWMLICKGMRTYRFLPLFFHTFYPCCHYPTPEETQLIMHDLGRRKYPGRYDPESGLVLVTHNSNYLNPQLAKIAATRLRDRHVGFFCKKNPGYASGDELLCLAGINPENVRPAILRRLEKNRKAGKEDTCPGAFTAQ